MKMDATKITLALIELATTASLAWRDMKIAECNSLNKRVE